MGYGEVCSRLRWWTQGDARCRPFEGSQPSSGRPFRFLGRTSFLAAGALVWLGYAWVLLFVQDEPLKNASEAAGLESRSSAIELKLVTVDMIKKYHNVIYIVINNWIVESSLITTSSHKILLNIMHPLDKNVIDAHCAMASDRIGIVYSKLFQ